MTEADLRSYFEELIRLAHEEIAELRGRVDELEHREKERAKQGIVRT